MPRREGPAPFVARTDETALLHDAVARAATGHPGVALVAGDAGVGKTRLLTRAGEVAVAGGARVVVGHCVDLGDAALPYLPFTEALSALRTQCPEVVDDAVSTRPALARLVQQATGVPPADAGGEAARFQLLDGIAAVLAGAGRPGRPVVLVLEDLHWADSSSRDVLRFLVARLRDQHLLVVASVRTDDLHRRHPLRPLLAEWHRSPVVDRLDLAPFTVEELREFTTAVAGGPLSPAVLDRVMTRSEGNAFFAEELMGAGPDASALPGSLAEVLLARLELLDDGAQRLVRAASVAGRRVAEPLLRAVAAAESTTGGAPSPAPASVDVDLRVAVTRHVLAPEEGDRLGFRHALLAEAVYADLLPGEAARLHAAYAAAIAADPALGSAAQLAHHAQLCHDLPTALAASAAAADDAGRLLAPAEVLRHLETVMQLWDAVPDAAGRAGRDLVAVVADAATAASSSGHTERAVALAAEAVRLAADDATRQAGLRQHLATYLLAVERAEEAFAQTGTAIEVLRGHDDQPALAWAAATHARVALNTGRDDVARTWAERALAVARCCDVPDAEADALTTLAVLTDDADTAAGLLAGARDRARDAGDLTTELRSTFNLAANRYYAGRLDPALEALAAGRRRAADTGLAWSAYGTELRVLDEVVRYAAGRWDREATAAGRGDAAVPQDVATRLEAAALYVAVARGEPGATERALALRPQWERDGEVALLAGGCAADGLAWRGDADAAVAVATDVVEHLDRAWSDFFLGGIWLSALALGALADRVAATRAGPGVAERHDLVAQGDAWLTRADRTAERGRPRGGRLGPEGRAWLLRAHAEHARLRGEDDPDRWAAVVEAFGYGQVYEAARGRWRRAQALLAGGDRVAAAAEAGSALADAERLGAAPLLAAVHDLGRRARLDLPGAGRRAPDVLTDREAEVLALVAHGLSNREIGERLFISAKTVSVHVSNLLAKLGVSGRAEAVDAAHRRGLLDTR